jgi:hypothetical protein
MFHLTNTHPQPTGNPVIYWVKHAKRSGDATGTRDEDM